MEQKITISDIAEKLDLSRSTVDRVLNHRGGVAPKTKKRVLNAVKKFGYEPNRAAKHLSKKTNCQIGVAYILPDWFGKQIEQGIKKVYSELKDFGLNITYIKNDSIKEHIKQIRNRISDIDALVLNPDSPVYYDLIQELTNKDMPVATFNRDLPSSNRFFYVGCNYKKAGRISGELMSKIVAKPGQIAIIPDDSGDRVKGFKEVLVENENLNILNNHYAEKDLKSTIELIIKNNSDLRGIFVAQASILEKVGNIIKDFRKSGEIKIIGFDLTSITRQLILEDVIQAVICQEPFYQGYLPVKLLFEYITEGIKPNKDKIISRLEIVMKENVDYYYNYHPYRLTF
ncbi:MAG: substrate-binding domain-containing protein [Bacillota bacterium]